MSLTNRLSKGAVVAIAATVAAPTIAGESPRQCNELQYPQTKTVNHTDTYHGIPVRDPYRWLEELDSEETRAWIKTQNEVTFDYLDDIDIRSSLRDRVGELWRYDKYRVPFREGGRYFYEMKSGLQNQPVLYTMQARDAEPSVLLDPNTLSEDGTIAVSGLAVSPDGRHLAYGLSSGGSDWQEWHVRDIETGEDLDDHLKWIKFSRAAWSPDGDGFYYSRYPAPEGENKLKAVNKHQKLYYHELGTPQSQDRLVHERPDKPEWGFDAQVTDDGNYLVVSVWRGTEEKNRVLYKDLRDPNAELTPLIDAFEAHYGFVGHDGPVFWFRTNRDAPRYRVVGIDIREPAPDDREVVIEQSDATLRSVNAVGEHFVANYLADARSKVELYELDGTRVKTLELPGMGTARGFTGERGHEETFYSFTSFARPATVYRYDFENGRSEVFRQPELAFDPSDYRTRQVFYESLDGTRVPMFITHKKGLEPSADTPAYLYGYGGFNIPITPGFSVSKLVWMEMGGLYVSANLRGGGEYGQQWHEAGMKTRKQNVFDDFIAAAEHLVAEGYTSRDKLAIAGRSNGGLLIGAAITQRPDLFEAALPAVGVMDMLRFTEFTIGWAWTSDYGSPENPAEFAALYSYSPYHNIIEGVDYPATLVTTADHDDRVFPAHSFKFAARLQAAHDGCDPVLIRVETRAGHGAGKPTSKQIDTIADRLGFLVRELDMSPSL